VHEAINNGYEVLEMHEVWHFEHTIKYDPETKSGGLFTEYINTMLKIKQEASGFPSTVQMDEQKSAYIDEYYEKEGRRLF
jgi:oxalate decarboxylase/phosphoglucose isomerase-like protein (cupin superfamily)